MLFCPTKVGTKRHFLLIFQRFFVGGEGARALGLRWYPGRVKSNYWILEQRNVFKNCYREKVKYNPFKRDREASAINKNKFRSLVNGKDFRFVGKFGFCVFLSYCRIPIQFAVIALLREAAKKVHFFSGPAATKALPMPPTPKV